MPTSSMPASLCPVKSSEPPVVITLLTTEVRKLVGVRVIGLLKDLVGTYP
ncbi:MAG: hypothetical protein U5L72_02410 [Bacteroidales bacterium]|nr:hypothetical protein [Bacteroidales bacterium]